MGNSMWLPKVVQSPECHEEFRNGPEVKIYIWEVQFQSREWFRGLSVLYRDHRKVFREPRQVLEGLMGQRGRGKPAH